MKKTMMIPVLLLAMVMAADSGHGAIRDAGEYMKKNVVTRKLKNGITVILLNRGYAPVLAFEISFRVGSVDENYRTIGAAHLLEHMLFKGTETVGTKDWSKERPVQARMEAVGETIDRLKLTDPANTRLPALEAELKRLQKEQAALVVSTPYDAIYSENGGVGFNASTSRDKTGYYIELPASRLEMWAKMESERLISPVLREFYLERNNVLQERLMHYDSIGTGLIFEQFMGAAMAAHPYRHPTIGYRSNIPFLSIEDVKKFYRDYYVPSRMTITVVGMQDTDKTFAVIEKYFGVIEERPDPAPVTIGEPKQIGERRFSMNFEANPYLMIGWHKPAFPSRDDLTCEVISEMLTGGKSSRLYRALVLERKIASSISAWNGAPGSRYDNLFILFAAPRPPHTPEELERAVYEEMDRFFGDVSEAELGKVVNGIESAMVFELETNKGIAGLLSYYQTLYGDWRYAADYLAMIKKVTIRDVKAMKEKYFSESNRTVGILLDSRAAGGKK
ncbi:MAG TPA: pitrilysin family protein [Spirochaetota bacterium]|nr:pitrilysin family protein [Spirochaetota bacterium]HPV41968.1 pitrilysin family protein [Spirochaetota bacterium]